MRLRVLAAALSAVPLAMLITATPASASVDGILFSVNPVQPGGSTTVLTTVRATGWTSGPLAFVMTIPDDSEADFAPPASFPAGVQCNRGDFTWIYACSWTPTAETDVVDLPAVLTVRSSATPGTTITVTSEQLGILPNQQTSDLLIGAASPTPTPTPTPTSPSPTPTPTPSASTSPTAEPTEAPVPTAVPAGRGTDGGSSAPGILLAAAAAVALAGGALATARRRGSHVA